MLRTIGIDFGTSTTVVCYRDQEEGQPPSDAQFLFDQKLIDTIVYEPAGGNPLFGEEARLAAEDSGKFNALVRNFKMDLLSEQKRARAEQRMRQLFAFLYERYRDRRNVMYGREDVVRTCVSYPAKWPPQLRQATIEAAQQAGFPNVQGIDEPTAAMQFFLAHQIGGIGTLLRDRVIIPGQPLNALLIDLGAGTTDIVIFRTTPGNTEGHQILGIWPTLEGASFGGRDVDAVLSRFFADYLAESWHPNVDRGLMEDTDEFLPDIVAHKENVLSPKLAKAETVETFQYVHRNFRKKRFLREDAPPDRMDRELFGEIAAEHLQTFVELIKGAIDDVIARSKLESADDIDLAILTGGHSRWYFVREILCGKWVPGLPGNPQSGSGVKLPKLMRDERRCLFNADPQTVVAQGLTLNGPVVETPAANSVWYELSVSFSGDQGVPRLWRTEVVQRGAVLPVRHQMFKSIDFDRLLADPNKLTVTAQMTAVVGASVETGLHFAADPSTGRLRLRTRVDAGIRAALEWVMDVAARPEVDKIPLGKRGLDWLTRRRAQQSRSQEHIDIYIEFEMTRPESVTYRGIIDLDSAIACWPFNYPSRPFAPDEAEALREELIRLRWHRRRSGGS